MVKAKLTGSELFSGGELRALEHELPHLARLASLRFRVKVAEHGLWPASDGHPAWKRKRIIINYLRKANAELERKYGEPRATSVRRNSILP